MITLPLPYPIVNRFSQNTCEDSVKNKRDRLFFTQLFVPQASQSSYDRRAELDVRLAIPSAQSACGMEIFTKNGMAVSAMPFFYRIGNFVSIR